MRTVSHRDDLPPCPHLPDVATPQTAAAMKAFGRDRGPAFYEGALTCAQSLWLQGLPAQAILQLNRAFTAELEPSSPVLEVWPWPYEALCWILRQAPGDAFLGNPRRHFQHLATRMSGPRAELRTWRAWACWHLSRLVRPEFPADEDQLAAENLVEPEEGLIEQKLRQLGEGEEVEIWRAVRHGCIGSR